MQTVKIKDLGKVITGKTPSTKRPELFGDSYPFVTPSDISSYDVYHLEETERGLSEDGYLSQKGKILPPRTVCYVCIGSTVGKICLTKVPSFTNQQLNNIIVNKEKFVPEYVYYRLRYETPRIQLIAGGTGSGKAIYNKTSFEEHQLDVHDFELQHRIATILSTYDDLIENNLRRIKILEEMAQTVYREWFVKFHFPGHEKVKMVDSPLGKIPEGWEVANLSEMADFIRGIEPGSKNYLDHPSEETVPFIRVGDLGSRQYNIFIPLKLSKTKLVHKTDIIITLDGTVGIVKIGLVGAYSSGIRKVMIKNAERIRWSYLYFLLCSEHIQNIIGAHAKGTTIKHAGSAINHMIFILPPRDLLDKFEMCGSVLLKCILNYENKNSNLRRTRDLLLPKLISGELDVSDLDIEIKGKAK